MKGRKRNITFFPYEEHVYVCVHVCHEGSSRAVWGKMGSSKRWGGGIGEGNVVKHEQSMATHGSANDIMTVRERKCSFEKGEKSLGKENEINLGFFFWWDYMSVSRN